MWKQMRANLYWIRLLIGSQWRSQRKRVMWADLGTLKMRRAEQGIIVWILSGEPVDSQQGEHYSNQTWREHERKREFWWLQKKDSVGLNRSSWSPGMQVDRVCSLVPLTQAGCQKGTPRLWAALENGMSLWPTHSEEGRSIPGAEPIRRISVLSSFNCSLFWTTLTLIYEMQDSMVRARVNTQKENQICTVQYHPQTCDERQSGD